MTHVSKLVWWLPASERAAKRGRQPQFRAQPSLDLSWSRCYVMRCDARLGVPPYTRSERSLPKRPHTPNRVMSTMRQPARLQFWFFGAHRPPRGAHPPPPERQLKGPSPQISFHAVHNKQIEQRTEWVPTFYRSERGSVRTPTPTAP